MRTGVDDQLDCPPMNAPPSRRALTHAGRVAVAAGLAVVLGACGSDDKKDKAPAGGENLPARVLDTGKVAKAIEQSVLDQRKRKVTVKCPGGIPQEKGLDFTCTASGVGTEKTDFTVSQTDNAGNVTYVAK